MKFVPSEIPDVILVEPDVYGDARGFFVEAWHERKYREGGIPGPWVQDNHSRSKAGTLRGLHMQLERPQGKLVRVVEGEVWDVAVDVRRGSPWFGQHVGYRLSADNFRQLWVPPGFAHGFVVTSDAAQFEYKCTDFYDADDELAIAWDDPTLAISWPVESPLVSDKDQTGLSLDEAMEQLPRYEGGAG